MKRKITYITLFFIFILALLTILFINNIYNNSNNIIFRKQLVELNAMETIVENSSSEVSDDDLNKLELSIKQCQSLLQETIDKKESTVFSVLLISFVCIIFVITIFTYIYYAILHPFDKMKGFADRIAQGNFDIPLNYERSNYFGAFTWAFDNMRKEIIKARQSEKEAIQRNKTVIATISHDIKTPITSIRAYTESLAQNYGKNKERDEKYVNVIIRKCDEVASLTNDLLLHSISDLEKLKIELETQNIKQLLSNILMNDYSSETHIHLQDNIPEGIVMLDKQRFEQVIENLINNSTKYAGTPIDVSCKIQDNDYIITIRDYGQGIPDENMPFIFMKFYRGKNVGNQPGSGLGLYITDYIVKKHEGKIKIFNHKDGLEAVLSFPMCTK